MGWSCDRSADQHLDSSPGRSETTRRRGALSSELSPLLRAKTDATMLGPQSSLEAALKLIRREGVVSLYDGLSSSLIGIAVTNGRAPLRPLVPMSR